jgi:predicted nucleotide-binding protein (sugar kinase/HSP70/actin superfamily)
MSVLAFAEPEKEFLEGKGHGLDPQLIEAIKESLNDQSRQTDFGEIINHPNFDFRAFLNYILENHIFEREELAELKAKVSSLKSKETLSNMKYLRENKPNVIELIGRNKEVVPSGVEV